MELERQSGLKATDVVRERSFSVCLNTGSYKSEIFEKEKKKAFGEWL